MTDMIAIRLYGTEAPAGLPARVAVAQEREAVALRRAGWLHHQDIHPRLSLVSLPRTSMARLVCESDVAYVSGNLGRVISELRGLGVCIAYQWDGSAWRRIVLPHLALPDGTRRALGLVASPFSLFERLKPDTPAASMAAAQRALATADV